MKVPKKAWYSDRTDALVVAANRKRAVTLSESPNLVSFNEEFTEVTDGNKQYFPEGLYYFIKSPWQQVVTPSSLAPDVLIPAPVKGVSGVVNSSEKSHGPSLVVTDKRWTFFYGHNATLSTLKISEKRLGKSCPTIDVRDSSAASGKDGSHVS